MPHLNKQNKPLKMVSLFSGIGGFELAFQTVGIETILTCEIDPIAQQVLRTNLPNVELVADVCDLTNSPEGTDILCAGFPCQDLSPIGCKIGLAGTRSSLVKEVFRLLHQRKVEWVIFENVPNMLHLNKGETIRIIVEELELLGYNWAYRTVDSLAFVPQRRQRVYIVASLSNDPRDVVLSGNSVKKQGEITSEHFSEPCGFYWTEGKYALGLYQNAIPTLKVGSSIGIPSPPAIAFPNGDIASPDIRDAERFQGFPENWTASRSRTGRCSPSMWNSRAHTLLHPKNDQKRTSYEVRFSFRIVNSNLPNRERQWSANHHRSSSLVLSAVTRRYSISTISSFSSFLGIRNRRMAKRPPIQAMQARLLQGSSWLSTTWRVIATVSTSSMLAGVVSMSIRTNSRPTTIASRLCSR